ncbi:MAG: chorismate mutase [Treponema sp.]|jgi:chorismate mutase/prephenate dehydratase|nr:chorismate mutase [Treponema sp.]
MDIDKLNEEMDSVDDQLLKLFEQRMELAQEIGRQKRELSLLVADSEHERKTLYRLCEKARPELAGYVKVLFSSLFEISRSHQKAQSHYDSAVKKLLDAAAGQKHEAFPLRATVACQGVEGAYSQAACDKLFSPADITYFNSFEGVFQAVDSSLCRFGVVPLENSSAGSVNEVYDLMNRYRFYIVRSIKLPITHTLLAAPGAKIDDIKEVFSHEQAIRQCSRFLKSWNGVKITECANTAIAAKQAASSGRTDAAVISSRDCAELYGLQALSFNIQNTDNNYTRFICISKKPEIYPGSHKTSLMLALEHKPGSLYSVLAKFYTHGINMNKLESRPISGQNFEFMFYFDIDTPVISDELKQVLAELEQETDMFDYLGTYQEF